MIRKQCFSLLLLFSFLSTTIIGGNYIKVEASAVPVDSIPTIIETAKVMTYYIDPANNLSTIVPYAQRGIDVVVEGAKYIGAPAATTGSGFTGIAPAIALSAANAAGTVSTVVSTPALPWIAAAAAIGVSIYLLWPDSPEALSLLSPQFQVALGTHFNTLYAGGYIPAELVSFDNGAIVMTEALKNFLINHMKNNMPAVVPYVDSTLIVDKLFQIHKLPYIAGQEVNESTATPEVSLAYRNSTEYLGMHLAGVERLLYLRGTHRFVITPVVHSPDTTTYIIAKATGDLSNKAGLKGTYVYDYVLNQTANYAYNSTFFDSSAYMQDTGYKIVASQSGSTTNVLVIFAEPPSYAYFTSLMMSLSLVTSSYDQDVKDSGASVYDVGTVVGGLSQLDIQEAVDTHIADGTKLSLNLSNPDISMILENPDGSTSLNPDAFKSPVYDTATDPGTDPGTQPGEANQQDFDQMKQGLQDKVLPGVFPKIIQRFRLASESDVRVTPPSVKVPLLSLLWATKPVWEENEDTSMTAPFGYDSSGNPKDEFVLFDFQAIDEISVDGLGLADHLPEGQNSLLDFIRFITGLGFVLFTFRTVWKKITPSNVLN